MAFHLIDLETWESKEFYDLADKQTGICLHSWSETKSVYHPKKG
jgi:hypothetical protein